MKSSVTLEKAFLVTRGESSDPLLQQIMNKRITLDSGLGETRFPEDSHEAERDTVLDETRGCCVYLCTLLLRA